MILVGTMAGLVSPQTINAKPSNSLPPSPSRPRISPSNPAGKSSATARATTWSISSASITSPASVCSASTARTKPPRPSSTSTVPEAGTYRLWVRYEYPAFCETRFRVVVEQDGKTVLDHVMGSKDSLRYAFRRSQPPKAQHDPSWGPEGLMEEVVDRAAFESGQGPHLPQGRQPSRRRPASPPTAHRSALSHPRSRRRLDETLRQHRPIFTPSSTPSATAAAHATRSVSPTSGTTKASFRISHVYNRIPWGNRRAGPASRTSPPAPASDWIGLKMQDTAHFGMVRFTSSAGPFELEFGPSAAAGRTQTCRDSGPSRSICRPIPVKETSRSRPRSRSTPS